MLKKSIRFVSDGHGFASSGFAWSSPRFLVWDDDAPAGEAWARELATIRAGDGTPSNALAPPPHPTESTLDRTG